MRMYLLFHSVKEPSKNRDIWVRFCSVLFGVRLGSERFGFLHTLLNSSVQFDLALGKIWSLDRFVLAGFEYFPISMLNRLGPID